MAETVIFAEQELTFTESGDLYTLDVAPALFVLAEGETYRVVLDGTEYELVCALDVNGILSIGHLVMNENEEATHGSFAIQYGSAEVTGTEGGATSILINDSSNSANHTLAIYQIIEDEEPTAQEGIVLKDRNGNDVAYYGIETVTFDTTTEGKQQVYTKGVAVEGLEIVPDFSGGDMSVMAAENTLVRSAIIKMPEDLTTENVRKGKEIGGVPGSFIGDTEEITVDLNMANGDQVISPSVDGKVLTKVTVVKPDTLIPENIAEGVQIGDIIGALKAGSGGSNVKIATGTIETGGSAIEVTHGLGVIPDIIILFDNSYISPPGVLNFAFSGTTAFFSNMGMGARYAFIGHDSAGSSASIYYKNVDKWCIDGSRTTRLIGPADETKFTCGTTFYAVADGTTWLAIGGLT